MESFRPERKRTALQFHGRADLPEVRYRVLSLLRSLGESIRFHAVVCDKLALLKRETTRRVNEPGYRYQPDTVYDGLVRSLFSRLHRLSDRCEVCLARRGNRDRNQALHTALQHAERDFESKYGFSRGGADVWAIRLSIPRETVCLQAVDYFLWAVQRFYEVRRHPETGEEIREDRFLNMLWPQIGEIHDLDFGPPEGAFFTRQRPLTLDGRFGGDGKRKRRS